MLRAAVIPFALCTLYVGAYGELRATHGLVHVSFFTSEEGLNGHHVHSVESSSHCGGRSRETVFAPLIRAEVLAHSRMRP